MKRRTNRTRPRSSESDIEFGPGSSSWAFMHPLLNAFDPADISTFSDISHILDDASDADGWLLFQTSFYPDCECIPGFYTMASLELKFLLERGLSVHHLDGGVVLVKDGVPIAGCSLAEHGSALKAFTPS